MARPLVMGVSRLGVIAVLTPDPIIRDAMPAGIPLEWLLEPRPAHAFLEQPQARTGPALANFHRISGLLAGANIPCTKVSHREWHWALGVPEGKEAVRERASQLLPQLARYWPQKKHSARAEAALLAFYGAQLLSLNDERS